MSRRINFSRRGELVISQNTNINNPNISQSKTKESGYSLENHSNLANSSLVNSMHINSQTAPRKESLGQNVPTMSLFGKSTSENVHTLKSSPLEQQGSNLPVLMSSNINTPYSGTFKHNLEKSNIMEKNGLSILQTRILNQSNSIKFNEDTLQCYAPYYKLNKQQQKIEKKPKMGPNGLADLPLGRFYGEQKRENYGTGDDQNGQKEASLNPNYAFPSNYKFDFKNYESYKKPVIIELKISNDLKNEEILRETGIMDECQKTIKMSLENQPEKPKEKETEQTNSSRQINKYENLSEVKKENNLKIKMENKIKELFAEKEENSESEKSVKIEVGKIKKEERFNSQKMSFLEAEQVVELFECVEGCGRSFVKEALKHHEKACKRIFQSKRKVFNSQVKRLALENGKEFENRGYNGKVSVNKVGIKSSKSKQSNWENKSHQLRKDLKNAKEKKGVAEKKVKDVPAKKTGDKIEGNLGKEQK